MHCMISWESTLQTKFLLCFHIEMVLVLENIAMEELDVRMPHQSFLDQLVEGGVYLHGQYSARQVRERRGEAPGAGADFEHHVVAGQLRMLGDEIDQVEIDEEILPQLVLGTQTTFLEEVP